QEGRAHAPYTRRARDLSRSGERSDLGQATGCGRVRHEAVHTRRALDGRHPLYREWRPFDDVSAPTLDYTAVAFGCLLEVAGRTLAVEIARAREARRFDEYTVVPLAPPQVIGMANLRGAIIPILDLGLILGLPPRASAAAVSTLVVEAEGVRL